MLPFIANYLSTHVWGPFRLLDSFMVLMGFGALLGAFLTWLLLPRLWDRLPHDHGKALTADGTASRGKPTGAGIILSTLAVAILLIVMPWSWRLLGVLLCLALISLFGYLDDAAKVSWSRTKKGLLDALVAVAAAAFFSEGQDVRVWLPFTQNVYWMSPLLFIPLAAFLLFICINVANCCDGIDSLAGSLATVSLLELAAFLYLVTGHNQFADYFGVPHYGSGASWAIMMVVSAGCLAGYIWHNAFPSAVLMGDAGSRFLGLLIGIGALATGNMLSFLIVAPIMLANGGGGLLKILILKALRKLGCDTRTPLRKFPNTKTPELYASDEEAARQNPIVRALHRVRFPLHDQCRREWGWSPAQVVVRFMLLQSFLSPILFLILIKLR